MAFNIKNYYSDDLNSQVKRNNTAANTQKSQVNKNYDNQISKATADANRQQVAAENSYDAAYADNAVQAFINKRQIETDMANSGLSDSGLNRTQLSAVQLQKTNADNAVTMQKTSFINKIKTQLNDNIYALNQQRNEQLNNIENNRFSNENTLRTKFDDEQRAMEKEIGQQIATILDPTQAAGYIKTVSKQYGIDPKELAASSPAVTIDGYKKYLKDEKYYKGKQTYEELRKSISSVDTSSAIGKTVVAKLIADYTTYNKSTKTKIKKILKSSGISYTEYNKFLKNGNYFADKEAKKNLEQQIKLKKASPH